MVNNSLLHPEIYNRLKDISATPRLDAQVLLAHVLCKDRVWVLAHPQVTLTSGQNLKLNGLLVRLERGVPLPYVIGHWEFYGLDFIVTPETLIPRPETELMVETALAWLEHQKEIILAADIGTGSGCIAVTLAKLASTVSVIASDYSFPTLKVARQNARKHNTADRIHFLQADLLPASNKKFNLVCANLPYIPSKMLQTLQVSKHEPNLALDGGLDGLSLIQRLLESAAPSLAPQSLFLLEIESSTSQNAQSIAQNFFPRAKIQLLPDLAGHDRLIRIENIPI